MANGNPYAINVGRPITQSVQSYMMGQQFAQQRAQRQAQQQQQALTRQYAPGALMGKQEDMAQLMAINPQMGMQIQAMQAQQAETQRQQQQHRQQQATAMYDQAKQGLTELAKIKDPGDQRTYLKQIENQLITQYGQQLYDDLGPKVLRHILQQEPELQQTLLALQGEALAPEADLTTLQQNLMAAGLKPGTPEYQEAVKKAVMKPQTEVKMPTPEKEFEKGLAKYNVGQFTGLQQQAVDAGKMLTTLNTLETLGEKAFSGLFAPAKKVLARLGDAFGIGVEGLSETEAFTAITNDLVLNKAGMLTGTISDKDMEFLRQAAPQLTQTAEGRKLLIGIMKEVANATRLKAQRAREFQQKFDRFDAGEFEQWLVDNYPPDDVLAAYYDSVAEPTAGAPETRQLPEGLPAGATVAMDDQGNVLILQNNEWVPWTPDQAPATTQRMEIQAQPGGRR